MSGLEKLVCLLVDFRLVLGMDRAQWTFMKPKYPVVFTMILAFATSPFVHGVIVGGDVTAGTGSFVKLSPGFTESDPDNTVGDDTFQNTNLYGFDEDQNVAVGPGGLMPDIGAFLTEGTIVASHYIFFDPDRTASQEGYILFDANIFAVFTSTVSLAESDYLANTGVTYLNPGLRGLEGGDVVSINGGNAKRLDVDWTASTPGDYVRVLTDRSPIADRVPDGGTSIALMACGIAALGAFRRRSR